MLARQPKLNLCGVDVGWMSFVLVESESEGETSWTDTDRYDTFKICLFPLRLYKNS